MVEIENYFLQQSVSTINRNWKLLIIKISIC